MFLSCLQQRNTSRGRPSKGGWTVRWTVLDGGRQFDATKSSSTLQMTVLKGCIMSALKFNTRSSKAFNDLQSLFLATLPLAALSMLLHFMVFTFALTVSFGAGITGCSTFRGPVVGFKYRNVMHHENVFGGVRGHRVLHFQTKELAIQNVIRRLVNPTIHDWAVEAQCQDQLSRLVGGTARTLRVTYRKRCNLADVQMTQRR